MEREKLRMGPHDPKHGKINKNTKLALKNLIIHWVGNENSDVQQTYEQKMKTHSRVNNKNRKRK